MARQTAKASFGIRLKKDLAAHKWVYLMFMPVLAWYIIFCYAPLNYLRIAFYDFNLYKGLAGSKWVGLEFFRKFFSSYYAWRLIRNTVLLSVYDICFSFPAPIILALLLNEVRSLHGKKLMQTISYMPHFISLVVVCGMLRDFSSSAGLFNQFRTALGMDAYNLLSNPAMYRSLHIGSGVWQSMGWSSIIYLATISTVDTQLYEAAYMDGANLFQRMLHVTLPCLVPIITVQFIMRLGSVMSVGYEKIILLYNSLTYETADVISTYLYRYGLLNGKYSMSTAIGLFNSVINVAILVLVNKTFSKFTQNSLW
ncbi:MAG TPA: ABC transporter permease subunit [Clostridia bacterium]|nr:ABC transporter permease subunit [Clostridia bacterium]